MKSNKGQRSPEDLGKRLVTGRAQLRPEKNQKVDWMVWMLACSFTQKQENTWRIIRNLWGVASELVALHILSSRYCKRTGFHWQQMHMPHTEKKNSEITIRLDKLQWKMKWDILWKEVRQSRETLQIMKTIWHLCEEDRKKKLGKRSLRLYFGSHKVSAKPEECSKAYCLLERSQWVGNGHTFSGSASA